MNEHRKRAELNHERFYRDDTVCRHGHTALRRTYNGKCTECERIAMGLTGRRSRPLPASWADAIRRQHDYQHWRKWFLEFGREEMQRVLSQPYADKCVVLAAADIVGLTRNDDEGFAHFRDRVRATNTF